jgi:integrase
MPQRYKLLVLLGAGAGLRRGEAFGLALDRIDAGAEMIAIDQQVIVVDRHPNLAPPKISASLRDVPMPQFVLDAVMAHADGLASMTATCCAGPTAKLLRRDY